MFGLKKLLMRLDKLSSRKNRDTTESKNHELFVPIAPYHYIHVLNLKTNITELVLGPQRYVCSQDEKVVLGPEKMISVPPMKYCVIENPVLKDKEGKIIVDNLGEARINLGDTEIRFAQDPFPLYPGEVLSQQIQDLPVVSANNALHLMALTNFVDSDGNKRTAGEEWLFEGPGTYSPRKEVTLVAEVSAKVIGYNKALVLEAMRDCVDRNGNQRVCGERWLVKTPGAYLPGVYEDVVEERTARILNYSTSLHVKALSNFTDDYGKQRQIGDEWLVTRQDAESHMCGVDEELVGIARPCVLKAHEYLILENPVNDHGTPQLGKKKAMQGAKCFFVQPGEKWYLPVKKSFILQMHEGLILLAQVGFQDEVVVYHDDGSEQKRKVMRRPGDQWMVRGPMEYFPPAEVKIVSQPKQILLDHDKGVYVQNTQNGRVRAVIGGTYMPNEYEKLWKKILPKEVVNILGIGKDFTRVVTCQIPHNAAVQIYDSNERKGRVEFGPNLAMLGPHEQFTLLSLSGGKPKQPNVIKSLHLLLGPDFCSDVIVVETADHARLSLQLSYNWHFEVPDPCSPQDAAKLFSVPDFVGVMCKAIASRIRGTVASVQFEDFHKHSTRIIRAAVFGLDEQGKVLDQFIFPQNNLYITNIDVVSVEPVDQQTRDSIQQSIQLAIEITANSQEAAARREAERIEQEARSRLERQKIEDATFAEQARQTLIEIKVQSAALRRSGQAIAEAKSRIEAARIEAHAAIHQSRLEAEAMVIETDARLEYLKKYQAAELEYINKKDQVTLRRKTEEAKIEFRRLSAMIGAIGLDTLRAIGATSPEHSVHMLRALGLQRALITDAMTPVNLSNTANGLIGTSMDMNRSERTHSTQDDGDDQ